MKYSKLLEKEDIMKEIILPNGLKVIFRPMPNTHSVTVGLYIKAGQVFGDEPAFGATHLLEHLHFRHCGRYSQKELYYKMEKIGSSLRGSIYLDLLEFYMKISPVYLSECLDIFRNIILSDEWTEDEFEKEKAVVKNQIYEESDYLDANDSLRQLIFRNHPAEREIMGTAEDVERMTLEDIKNYKKQIFDTSRMILCITGNVTETLLSASLAEIGKIPLPDCGFDKEFTAPPRFGKRKPDVKFLNDVSWDMLDVRMGFDVPVGKYESDMVEILASILGDGVGSRLQLVVREEKGYTSDIYSWVGWGGKVAVLYISFTVAKANLLSCCEEIGKVLEDMKREITKEDLDISLPFFTENMMFYEDDSQEMNKLLAHSLMTHQKNVTPCKATNSTYTMTKLQDIAGDVFRKENLSLIIAGRTGKMTHKSVIGAIFKEK